MIDQTGLKRHQEIMKCSFLENWGFRTATLLLAELLYWCSSIIFRTFNLKNTYSANIFGGYLHFMLIAKKPLKNGTNEKKLKVTNKEFSFK